jgi:hypothetical protein
LKLPKWHRHTGLCASNAPAAAAGQPQLQNTYAACPFGNCQQLPYIAAGQPQLQNTYGGGRQSLERPSGHFTLHFRL